MAFDRLFCPIRSSKSAKKSISSSTNTTSRTATNNDTHHNSANHNSPQSNNANHNNSNTSNTNGSSRTSHSANAATTAAAIENHHRHHLQHATSSIPYRYVTDAFEAKMDDELDVMPGDVVLYEFTDSDSNGNWAHVCCLKTNKHGFVPNDILSTEPRRIPQCKKKLPRGLVGGGGCVADPNEPSHHHLHSHPLHRREGEHHRHHHHYANGEHSLHNSLHHGDRLHHLRTPPNNQHPCAGPPHQHQFVAPHSSKGSSGKQSYQKYPPPGDLRHFASPAYCNLRTSDPQYERYLQDMECRPTQFLTKFIYGVFVVLHNFVAREENDLNVKPGEFVTVLNKDDDDWYWVRRECDQYEGFVPAKFICDYEVAKSMLNKGNSTITMKSSVNQNDCHTYMNHAPDREIPVDQQSSLFQVLG